jgi:hypothetical protein
MKKLTLCILTLGLASHAFGSACVQGGSFSSYQTAGSCTFTANGNSYTLQDLTFLSVAVLTPGVGASDFSITESAGTGGPKVTITPDSNIAISSILAATETFLFGFDITSNNSSIGFTNVNLSEQSSLSSPVPLVGATGLVAEEDCFGGALPLPGSVNIASLGSGGLACLNGGVSVGASIALGQGGVGANASIGIPINGPFTNSVDVLKELNLTAVGLVITPGTASVSSIGQTFTTNTGSAAPEPGSFLLGGCGLLGVALILRYRTKSKLQPCVASK